MGRIKDSFMKKKVFAAYVTSDAGLNDYLFESVKSLMEGGINMLEIGVPFSDPIADGPVIQGAMQDALERGTTLKDSLNLARKIRSFSEIPLVLFTYFNPILAHGENVYKLIREAGFDGILIVDLPLEEASLVSKKIKQADLDPIFILTPSTSEKRLPSILDEAQGFIYYVCQKGTTGVREALPADFENNISKIKKRTALPILAGFGISNYESAKGALSVADGFVVGSAIVKMIVDRKEPKELKLFAEKIDPREG